jgi:hypothetical protein
MRADRHTQHHGLRGRQYGASAKDGETIQTQNSPSAPRPGTVEKRSVEFARGTQFANILRSRDRRVHRLILLGATIGIQPICCPTLSILPGAEQSRSLHNHVRLAAVRRLAYEASDTSILQTAGPLYLPIGVLNAAFGPLPSGA